MSYDNFKVTITDYVARIAFNRPDKSNALDHKAWEEMKIIFDDLSRNSDVRCVILSGEGKHFCAGIDLSLLMDITRYEDIDCEGRKREKLRDFIYFLQDAITSIEKCRKPVLAAIHGACIGGAVDIIAACDIRYCTEDAYFSIKEVDMGLVADIGTMQRLPKIINPGIMAEMAYTGRKMAGTEAQAVALVTRAYTDKETLMSEVINIASNIATKAPIVIRGTKEILLYTRDHSVEESLRYMGTFNSAYLMNEDIKEAMRAQMMRDTPVFKYS